MAQENEFDFGAKCEDLSWDDANEFGDLEEFDMFEFDLPNVELTGDETWHNGTVLMSRGRLLAVVYGNCLLLQQIEYSPLEEDLVFGRAVDLSEKEKKFVGERKLLFESYVDKVQDPCYFGAVQNGTFVVEGFEMKNISLTIFQTKEFIRATIRFVDGTIRTMALIPDQMNVYEEFVARKFAQLYSEGVDGL
jgi:hypothetical protein